MSEVKHGTYYGYAKQGCRCDPCRKANTERMRRWRAERKKQETPHYVHGRNGYVNYGCRCDVCRADQSEYMKEWERKNSGK